MKYNRVLMLLSIAVAMTACTKYEDARPAPDAPQYIKLADTVGAGLYKTYDLEEGNVCYLYVTATPRPALNCMVSLQSEGLKPQ